MYINNAFHTEVPLEAARVNTLRGLPDRNETHAVPFTRQVGVYLVSIARQQQLGEVDVAEE